MYRFSRSIYRELSPHVQENGASPAEARRHLLDASEATMRRLVYDGKYFARPARTLFTDVRTHFPMSEQLHAFQVINTYVGLALEHLEQLPDDAVGLDGVPRRCRASTRKGTPCRRQPLPARDYCPSHKHLEEDLEVVEEHLAEHAPTDNVGAAA
jgi:hypothetical protein